MLAGCAHSGAAHPSAEARTCRERLQGHVCGGQDGVGLVPIHSKYVVAGCRQRPHLLQLRLLPRHRPHGGPTRVHALGAWNRCCCRGWRGQRGGAAAAWAAAREQGSQLALVPCGSSGERRQWHGLGL